MSGLRCGSISSTIRVPPGTRCHPAQNERAPLRPGDQGVCRDAQQQVIPLKMSGLRCGGSWSHASTTSAGVIPLKISGLRCGHDRKVRGDGQDGRVIPLKMSGLRCGLSSYHSWVPAYSSGHPAQNERAPLRLFAMPPLFWALFGHPAQNERAPLRPGWTGWHQLIPLCGASSRSK